MVVAVLAIHNEEKFLPFILSSLDNCVDGVVAVLDNCVDDSEVLIDRLKNIYVKKVFLKKHFWKYLAAESKSVGLKVARKVGGYILVTDSDLLLDSFSVLKAKKILDNSNFDVVVFTYKQYSLGGSVFCRFKDELVNCYGKFVNVFSKQPVRTGIYLVRASKADFYDIGSEYDRLLGGLKTTWVFTDFKHLRPRYDVASQLLMGYSRCVLGSYNIFKILLSSFCTFSPAISAGFLKKKISDFFGP